MEAVVGVVDGGDSSMPGDLAMEDGTLTATEC